MADAYVAVAFAVVSALIATLLPHLFKMMPEAWLQDYDYDSKAENVRLARRLQMKPHGIILAIVLFVFVLVGVWLNQRHYNQFRLFNILLIILPLYPLSLIVVSDKLNRIIPDQLVAISASLGIFGILTDLLEGNLWFDAEASVTILLVNRFAGAIIGAGLLLLIGFIGRLISGQDAMGMGDVKFIFACGMLSGGFGLIFVFCIAFVVGGIVSVPLLIRKRRRIAREEHMILESPNPARARRVLEKKKKEMNFADNPDYVAFGPFLALGTALFLVFEPLIHSYYLTNILPSLELML